MKKMATWMFCIVPVGIVLLSMWWESFTQKHPLAADPSPGNRWLLAFFACNLLTGIGLFLTCYAASKMERKRLCAFSGGLSVLLFIAVLLSPYGAMLLQNVISFPISFLWCDERIVIVWGFYVCIFVTAMLTRKKGGLD
ncbi:MAG: hypothetical protein ACI4LN_04485 [Anaerovoracaceae bacterium]